jgi:hypothetical protein
MAEITYPDAFKNGYEIGQQLYDGKVDEAKSGYAKVMERIQAETQDERIRAMKKDWVEGGMEKADPIDVKGPGNGTDNGHYVYWNPQVVTNEVNSQILNFCQSHNKCLTLGMGTVPQDRIDANKFVWNTLNKYLDTALPDPLEKYVFIQDFNRRRFRSDFTAFRDESFSAQIYLQYSGMIRPPNP